MTAFKIPEDQNWKKINPGIFYKCNEIYMLMPLSISVNITTFPKH